MSLTPRYVCTRCCRPAEDPSKVPAHRAARLAARLVTNLRLAGCRCPHCQIGRYARVGDDAPGACPA